jgi:hypothetical protein
VALYLYTLDLGSVRESADSFEIRVAERRGDIVYLNCGDVFFAPANVSPMLEGGETVSLLPVSRKADRLGRRLPHHR